MAGTFGYGLRGFTSGFQTGLGLGMERKKIKMLQEEQERAEKLAKQKEENATNWYNTNKDSLLNFQTQPQETRNMLIFESIKYSDDWNDYLRDSEKALQAGDLEELKHLNDMAEEKIKAESDMLNLGVRPENAFIGKYYTEEDMDYVKKLRMGALGNRPIGTQMYEEQFGKLPAETKEPTITDYTTGLKYLTNIVNVSPENWETAKKGLEVKFGVDYSGITQEALKEAATEDKKYYSSAEEAMTTSPDIKGLSKQPVQISLNQWKVDYTKETVIKPKTIPAPTSFKTLQDIKDSFKNVKTKAEYDSAIQSYNASKEAKTSDWTPPAFERQLTDLIKRVEDAIWSDYVNKDGKLKSKEDAEEYNANLQHYLDLIDEARNTGIDISQFQAFIPYKELYWGRGNPLVTKESW